MSQRCVDAVAIPTRHPSWFRFSLQGLLVTITLIAVALAVTSWSIWDLDEVWILSSWTCGALGLGILDRARGKLGIVAAALGGGLAPAAVVLHLRQSPDRYPLAHALWLSELGHNSVLLALTIGAMIGAIVAALYCLARSRPWWLVVIAVLLAIGLFAVRLIGWNERAVFELTSKEAQRPFLPQSQVLALTSDGTRLAVGLHFPTNQQRLEIWSIGDVPFRESATDVPAAIHLMEFSPDGSQLAIGRSSGQPITIHDAPTGASERTLQLPPNVSSLSRYFRFTDDGSAVVGSGLVHYRYRSAVLAWDAQTCELLCLVANPRPTLPAVSFSGNLAFAEALERAREQELAADRELEPRSDSDHHWLAIGRELLELDGAKRPPLSLPYTDQVVARSDKWAVIVHRQPNLSPLYMRCPFIRRLDRSDDLRQLRLVDPASGKVVRESRWMSELDAVALSRDDGTIAAVTADGKVRIWDAPD
jgi:hypothetical protein